MSLQSDLELLERLYAKKQEKRVARSRVELEESEVDDQIAVVNKRIEINTSKGVFTNTVVATNQDFIAKHSNELESEDIEFLSVAFRGAGEVLAKTGWSASHLRRLVRDGKVSVENRKARHFKYDTVSIMEYTLSEDTETEA